MWQAECAHVGKSCRHMVGGIHVSVNPVDIRGGWSECDNYFTFPDSASTRHTFPRATVHCNLVGFGWVNSKLFQN